MQRRSRALRSHSSRIPWIATAVVCQATHARLLPRPLTIRQARGRHRASLNASAAGESTTAGDLEAASTAGDFEAVPLDASGRVDPSGWPWNFLPQRVTGLEKRSPYSAGVLGPHLPSESREKRDPKLHLQPTCTTQDVVTSMSSSAMKRAAERPPLTAKGVPEQKKTVPRVGALSRFSGRCPFSSLCTWGSNVPRFQCPGASTRGSNVSGFQCPKGGENWLC